jgi:hypothetical protein
MWRITGPVHDATRGLPNVTNDEANSWGCVAVGSQPIQYVTCVLRAAFFSMLESV